MPGVYDIGTSALVLKPFVTVAGSGRNATKLRGSGGVSPSSGFRAVVFGADNAEVHSLTIEGTGPGIADAAIVNDGTAVPGASTSYTDVSVISQQMMAAVFNQSSSPVLRDVTIVSDSLGMRNLASTPSLTDVTIAGAAGAAEISNSGDVAPGGPANGVPLASARVRMKNARVDGFFSVFQSHIELENVRIEGPFYGINGFGSRITMRDTGITIEGGSNSEGLVTTDSYVTMSQSGITVRGGKAAVEVAGQGFLVVDHSALVSLGGSAIIKGGGAGLPVLLGQTKVVGPLPPGLTCVNVYDGVTYQPVVCPP
jgi:hypothetical protein